MTTAPNPKDLTELAESANLFNHNYYDVAEGDTELQWKDHIWPVLSEFDLTCTLDLAAGHGRISQKLVEHASKVYAVDISEEAVDFCKRRFADVDKVVVIRNNGFDLSDIPDEHLTAIVSIDSMVHFDSDIVRRYIREFERILKPGGRGYVWHSNYSSDPAGDIQDTYHWRGFMSKELFAHWCHKEGLKVISQQTTDNASPDTVFKDVDCRTLFVKPDSREEKN